MLEDEITQLMSNAKDDLTASVSGRFSPDDWEKILELAKVKWAQYRRTMEAVPAWQEVVREFRFSGYWGFKPDYRETGVKKKRNLGYQLAWMTFQSMVLTKVAVLWFGQNYSNDDESFDKWIFFLVLFLIPANAAFFVWRNRHHKDVKEQA